QSPRGRVPRGPPQRGAGPRLADARRRARGHVRRRGGRGMSQAQAVSRVLSRLRLTPSAIVVGGLLIVLLVLNAWLNPARLAPEGLLTTFGLAAWLILAALASTPSILSGGGGIDISIGPMIGFLNVVMVRYLFME